MKIGLIDIDHHNFPNIALMKISAYHKAQGDSVEWYDMFGGHFDRVYVAKVFSFSPDYRYPIDADEVIYGGTGYQIRLIDGKETWIEPSKTRFMHRLPDEVEHMYSDYALYHITDTAYGFLTRGCPRGCSFCHVAAKEGRCSVKVADVSDFWCGQKKIEVLDPNITACRDKRDLFRQYRETKAQIVFNQGLDIRLLNDEDIADINGMRIKDLHFAWDNPKDDLEGKFRNFANGFRRKSNIGMVYCLTNFNSTMEENLYRIYTLRDMGYDPYVMVYDKPHAPKEIKMLQRWCNNKIIFKSCKRFEDYEG
jgi:hypothetical protein